MFISKSKLRNLVVYWNLVVCGILGIGYLLISDLYAVSVSECSAYLPRDNNRKEFTINFKLTNLGNAEISGDTIYEKIKIVFPDYSGYENESIPDANAQNKNENIKFTKSLNTEISPEKNDNQYEATVSILIKETENGALNKYLVKDNKIRIAIYYDSETALQTFYTTIPSPINAAPDLTNIKSGFRSIKVEWTVPTNKLPHVDGNDSSIPTNMDIILIKNPIPETGIPFPAKEYKQTDKSESLATCTIKQMNIPENTIQDCNIECSPAGDYIYLDTTTSDEGTPYKIVPNVSVEKGSTTIGGKLEPGTSYTVFAQYQPTGVQRSKCGLATPYTNYSFSEYYEGTTSKEDDLSCFIATAAYGSAFTKELKILRWFRDTYLKSNTLGKKLVDIYYKYSPNLAKKIEKSPILAKITRTLLYIPVGICYLLFFLNPTGSSFIGFILLTGLVFTMFLFIRKKIYKKD